jgi:CxxC motif-containing protein (DUF1111 family)/predicted lipoprotein with Yx(FWY)xxD motif
MYRFYKLPLIMFFAFLLSGTSLVGHSAEYDNLTQGNELSWDIDANGQADALTDGLLMLRYSFGLRGEALIAGAVSSNSNISAVDVESRIDNMLATADIDGNSKVDALTDGLLLLRYLFGHRDEALLRGALGSSALRSSIAEVTVYLDSFMPNQTPELIDGDNDGVVDADDAFPNDASETLDSDNDGVGDNTDAFPNDASETADTDNDGVGNNADAFPNDPNETADLNNNGTGDNADADADADASLAPLSDYCASPLFHLGIAGETQSQVNLTIENVGNNTVRVSIVSADSSAVDVLIVEGGSGASIVDDTSASDGAYTKLLSWSNAMPDSATVSILWSKTSSGGNWIQRDISLETAATCSGASAGTGNNNGSDSDNNNGGTGTGTGTGNGNDGGSYEAPPIIIDEVNVSYVALSGNDAQPMLVGGAGSSQPGFALYVFDSDTVNGTTSNCNGGCANAWPPLLVTDSAPSGIQGLDSITRDDNSEQVTYQGRPLYFYVNDTAVGEFNGDNASGWHSVVYQEVGDVQMLYGANTALEPATSFDTDEGVIVTRLADRGRDRHAKDSGDMDHYDHYLAHYWEYRTMRIQLEDYVPTGKSLIKVTWITESELGAKEFRVWYAGASTSGQFWFNPQPEGQQANPNEPGVVYHGTGTWNDNFEKVGAGDQHKYTLNIDSRWQLGGQIQEPLQLGMNMEFESSMFLVNPPAGSRLNYYGTSFVYKIGQPGVHPFEWEVGQQDGSPIPQRGLSGGGTTLGYNYTNEPAGRFMQMATNMAPGNADPFVLGRRIHHTSFVDGIHDERSENPVWTEQANKSGTHYINESCADCHVRNGRALVADVGGSLDKWVFRVGDANGNPMSSIGSVLQPTKIGNATSEGSVTLGPWTNISQGEFAGLRSPNYQFTNVSPPQFSARIAPSLVGMGLLEAVDEATILSWVDEDDSNNDGISGRASMVEDPENGEIRLGRFGYKAGTFSVKHQVASAFNTDMGVMTSMIPNPDCGSEQASCGNSGSEIADEHVNNLVKYVSLLGVGARRDYANQTGETLFDDIGCAGCHRPSLVTSNSHPLAELRGQTIYPYTDMLLHDMGDGLADNLAEGFASGAEWRTSPLWGLGLVKNVMLGDTKANDLISIADAQNRAINEERRIGYLHDGRARTIDEAIRWHGGEAQASKIAYEALSDSERNAVINFLESL